MPDSDIEREESPPAARQPRVDEPTGGALPAEDGLSAPGMPTRIGRFEIRALLGEGACGRVYHGFDPQLHRDVAIKVPHPHGLTPAFRERFLREARAAATIHHPNVCPVYEAGTECDLPFIVMHFVQGGTLDRFLAAREAPVSPRNAVAIVRRLALGVAAAHARGIIHRDLKPRNVLWDEANREVLVTDFGMARIGAESQLSRTGDVLGTPAYMSPEQGRGRPEEVGPLTDVYSLGVILYRLLTDELPFRGSAFEVLAQTQFAEPTPPSALRPGLDPALDAICLRAMAKNPDDRFPSARAFADVLSSHLLAVRAGDSRASGELPVVSVRSPGPESVVQAPLPPPSVAPPDPVRSPAEGERAEVEAPGLTPEPASASGVGGRPDVRTGANPIQAGPEVVVNRAPPWTPDRQVLELPGAEESGSVVSEPSTLSTPGPNATGEGGPRPSGQERFVCPNCRARLLAKAGRSRPVRCPRCRSRFAVEAGRTAARQLESAAGGKPVTVPKPAEEKQPKVRRQDQAGDPPSVRPAAPQPRPTANPSSAVGRGWWRTLGVVALAVALIGALAIVLVRLSGR